MGWRNRKRTAVNCGDQVLVVQALYSNRSRQIFRSITGKIPACTGETEPQASKSLETCRFGSRTALVGTLNSREIEHT